MGPRIASEAQARGTIEEYGRQFGGGGVRREHGGGGEGLLARGGRLQQRCLCDGQQGGGRGGRAFRVLLSTNYERRSVWAGGRRHRADRAQRAAEEDNGRAGGVGGSRRGRRVSTDGKAAAA